MLLIKVAGGDPPILQPNKPPWASSGNLPGLSLFFFFIYWDWNRKKKRRKQSSRHLQAKGALKDRWYRSKWRCISVVYTRPSSHYVAHKMPMKVGSPITYCGQTIGTYNHPRSIEQVRLESTFILNLSSDGRPAFIVRTISDVSVFHVWKGPWSGFPLDYWRIYGICRGCFCGPNSFSLLIFHRFAGEIY